jgi:DNA-binding transcriptional ArsR family regulator
MQFDVSLETIMGSKAKLKILKYLFGHQAAMSENELARVIRVSAMTINRLMKELRQLNLVSMERVGNANVWAVNKESYAYTALSKIMGEVSSVPPLPSTSKKLSLATYQKNW